MDEKPKQLVKETRTPIACGRGRLDARIKLRRLCPQIQS